MKNLRLKSRIYSQGSGEIIQLVTSSSYLMILHERDVAFTSLHDNKIGSVFCEGSFTGEYSFEQIVLEKHRA